MSEEKRENTVEVPQALLDAVAFLRTGRDRAALEALDTVVDGDGDGGGLSDALAARALGLRAQALSQLGRLEEAVEDVDDAIRLARALGDKEGIKQLRGLSGQLRASLAAAAQRKATSTATAETPLSALLSDDMPPLERAMVLVRKADAELDVGRIAAGRFLAARALEVARAEPESTREQVYAWLALARAEPERASQHLHDARDLADRTNNQAMITAVAHAARAAGVVFEPYSF